MNFLKKFYRSLPTLYHKSANKMSKGIYAASAADAMLMAKIPSSCRMSSPANAQAQESIKEHKGYTK